MTIESLRLYIKHKLIKLFANKRQKKLKYHGFTIISNNCWGGMVYESFGLQKQSPTIGLFFMAEEYIRFLERFPEILFEELTFINPCDSKYAKHLSGDSRFGSYPIGVLGGIEICFLHYKSKEEASEKWKRRVKRVNLNRIIFKINDQNLCSLEILERFSKLPFEHKIIFSSKNINLSNLIWIKTAKKQQYVCASQEPIIFKNYFNIINYINDSFASDHEKNNNSN